MDSIIPMIGDKVESKKVNETNAVVLAYVGDAVESLYVRSILATTSTAKSHTLHLRASRIVNATSQARRAERLLPLMTEDEVAIYRRGMNSKVHSSAKNADLLDYKSATGLEAVYGYLYLSGNSDRLSYLLEFTKEDIIQK